MLGEETLWRAGCEGYVVGRRCVEGLLTARVNPRKVDNPDARILRCGKGNVRDSASTVTGAIAAFGGSSVMRTSVVMTRHAMR